MKSNKSFTPIPVLPKDDPSLLLASSKLSRKEKLLLKGRAMTPTSILIQKRVSFLRNSSLSQTKIRVQKHKNSSFSLDLKNSKSLTSKPKTPSVSDFQQLAKGFRSSRPQLKVFKVNLDTEEDSGGSSSRSRSRVRPLGSGCKPGHGRRDSNFTTNDSLQLES